jgi:hypothetical protein
VTDRLWRVVAASARPTHEHLSRFVGPRMLPRIAELLPYRPVGCYLDDGSRQLDHPPIEEYEAYWVGRIVGAFATTDNLIADLEITAPKVQRTLERLEHYGLLAYVGVSLRYIAPVWRQLSGSSIGLEGVAGIAGLDFVSKPSCRACHILRSVVP